MPRIRGDGIRGSLRKLRVIGGNVVVCLERLVKPAFETARASNVLEVKFVPVRGVECFPPVNFSSLTGTTSIYRNSGHDCTSLHGPTVPSHMERLKTVQTVHAHATLSARLEADAIIGEFMPACFRVPVHAVSAHERCTRVV